MTGTVHSFSKEGICSTKSQLGKPVGEAESSGLLHYHTYCFRVASFAPSNLEKVPKILRENAPVNMYFSAYMCYNLFEKQ